MTETTQGEAPLEAAPTEIVESAPTVETTDDAGPVESPAEKPRIQTRIDDLTRHRREAERERDYWREQALNAQKPAEAPKAEEPIKVPKLADFDFDDDKYQAAVLETQRAIARAEVRQELEAERQRAQESARQKTFNERVEAFAKTTPDFDPEKIFSARYFPVNEAMSEVIQQSELGPELLYWVDSHQEQARKIYDLPPLLAAKEMGRIERELIDAKRPPKPVTVTQAPPPAPTIEAVEPAIVKDLSDPKLSDAEFAKIRARQIAQRR